MPAAGISLASSASVEDDNNHLYITNLSSEEFLPDDIAKIYRYGLVVERLFRELKTQYGLDEFYTTKEHIVKILVYAALLALLVSRELLALMTERSDEETVFSAGHWAATL